MGYNGINLTVRRAAKLIHWRNNMPKMLIIVEGGLVSDVYSDVEGLEVRLLDMDVIEQGDEEDYEEFVKENIDLLHNDGDAYESVDESKILKQYPYNNY